MPMGNKEWVGVVKRLTQRLMPELHQEQSTQTEKALNFSQTPSDLEPKYFASSLGTVVIHGLPRMHKNIGQAGTCDALNNQTMK